jgi:hypothetical protein
MLFRNNYFSLYFASGSPEEIKTMCVSFIRWKQEINYIVYL